MSLRLTPPQRDALRGHYLITCAIRPDKTWDWRCSCRGDGGNVPDAREAHRMFAEHLDAVKILAKG